VTVPYAACIQLYPPEDEHLRLRKYGTCPYVQLSLYVHTLPAVCECLLKILHFIVICGSCLPYPQFVIQYLC